MSVNIRYPNITGLSDKEQITQIKSYLHQLVEQLNYELTTLGSVDGSAPATEVQGEEISYYELRSLIVQQLQEVKTLFDQLEDKLETGYVKDEELPAAINTALEQAKESGEFDGPQGPQGPQGEKGDTGPQGPKGDAGAPGADGNTPVYGVDFALTDGDVNTIVTEVVGKISFTLDTNGNLYYEVEE